MRGATFLAVALTLFLWAGCGGGEITEEQYVELKKALAVAEANGEPLQPVYEEHGIDPEQVRAFEAARSPEELAELTGRFQRTDFAALPRMDEATYIELSRLTVRLAGEGTAEDKIQVRLEEELTARGYTMSDWDAFGIYMTQNPKVRERVESAMFETLEAMDRDAAGTARRRLEGPAADAR